MDKETAQPVQEPVEEWQGQSNIESLHNACQHRAYCKQLKVQPAQQSLTAPQSPWLKYVKGVRVDGDNVVISCKGSEGANEAARTVCSQILAEKGRSTTSGGA